MNLSQTDVTDNGICKRTMSNISQKILRLSSVLPAVADISKINFIPATRIHEISKEFILALNSTGSVRSLSDFKMKSIIKEIEKDDTKFSDHLASRTIDETNLWGQFYNFPELYEDEYCHVIRTTSSDSEAFRNEDGLLTREMVRACLSYFRQIPILGDYVYIKLDLSMKLLVNIDVLQHYKYLVYLNLSTNCISDISVLSHLLYLQYLSVDLNKLSTVLNYDTPQWMLTEVYYRYNEVVCIRDLSLFWSLTILDLSHNRIKYISGLENLRFLRRLDLSFNQIQRLEGLNHLRLLWLDISHNDMTSFECGPNSGLKTLLHLEYLNVDTNNFRSLRVFSGCTRLRQLHACDNHFDTILDLPLFMWMHRRLVILDLRYNPICDIGGYRDVVIRTLPTIFQLDGDILDPVEIRTVKMEMSPDVSTAATRRLLRVLYIEQLSRARVSPYVPPADTTEVPLVVLVGYEAVGKGKLARRIAEACNTNVELAVQHTTSSRHLSGHYKVITRNNFDNMLRAGEFLTYSEADGESYGLSREEAFVSGGKVKIVTMDLIGALMLRLRGYRPYLILATCSDKQTQIHRQNERRSAKNDQNEKCDCGIVTAALQAVLSGRLNQNEVFEDTCHDTCHDKFVMHFDIDPPIKKVTVTDTPMFLNSDTTIDSSEENDSPKNASLYTLYKSPQTPSLLVSDTYRGLQEMDQKKGKDISHIEEPLPSTKPLRRLLVSHILQLARSQHASKESTLKLQRQQKMWNVHKRSETSKQGEVESSTEFYDSISTVRNIDKEDHKQYYKETVLPESYGACIRDDYESIHRNCPGLFWDVITMDNNEEAFLKLKKIIKQIVNSQKNLKPLYDIDFTNNDNYGLVKKKTESVLQQIAPHQLFN